MGSLRAAHREVARNWRVSRGSGGEAEVDREAILAAIEAFIVRGAATGIRLEDEKEQEAAQSLLDYWSTTLLRAGVEPPDATLAAFEPDRSRVLADDDCPYPQLGEYPAEPLSSLYRRESFLSDVLALVDTTDLLWLVGPSGSGRSSLVKSGLLSALQEGVLPGSEDWRQIILTPGQAPMSELVDVLRAADAGSTANRATVPSTPRHSPEGIRELAGQLATGTVVLVVDKLDGVFSLCDDEDERQLFLRTLIELAGPVSSAPAATGPSPPVFKVVVTVRADYMDMVANLSGLDKRDEMRIPPLSASLLRQVILQPAGRVGLEFDPAVVDALVQDVLGEPAALFLLQFTLLQLWDSREGDRVTWSAYSRQGGGRVSVIRQAASLYETLDPDERALLGVMLVRMVHVGANHEMRPKIIRRDALEFEGHSAEAVDGMLDRLAAHRLIRCTRTATGPHEIELVHNALIYNWTPLVEWMADARDRLRVRYRFEAKAREWERLGRSKERLLGPAELAEAERWLATGDDTISGLDRDVIALLGESRHAIKRARRRAKFRRNSLTAIAIVIAAVFAYMSFELAKSNAQSEDRRELLNAQVEYLKLMGKVRSHLDRRVPDGVTALEARHDSAQSLVNALTESEKNAEGNLNVLESVQRQLSDRKVTLDEFKAKLDEAKGELKKARRDSEQELQQISERRGIIWEKWLSEEDKKRERQTVEGLSRRADDLINIEGGQLSLLLAIHARLLALSDSQKAIADNNLQDILDRVTPRSSTELRVESPVWGLGQALIDSGRIIATGDEGGAVTLWNAGDASKVQSFPDVHEGIINDLALQSSAGSLHLATVGRDGRLSVRSTIGYRPDGLKQEWKETCSTDKDSGPIYGVAFRPGGARLVTAHDSGSIKVWEAADCDLVRSIEAGAPVFDVAFSPDGERFVTAGGDGTASLWDAEHGQGDTPLEVFPHAPGTLVFSAEFDPSSSRIVTTASDAVIRIWEPGKREVVAQRSVDAPPGEGSSTEKVMLGKVAISPDGSEIAVAVGDGRILLYDRDLRGEPIVLREHQGPVFGVRYYQEGESSVLLSGSLDGSARVWQKRMDRVDADTPVDRARRQLDRDLDNDECVALVLATGMLCRFNLALPEAP